MKILTCIQDNIYLCWQAELLHWNVRQLGKDLVILCGYTSHPSAVAKRLHKRCGAVLLEDTRVDRGYAPSIQPHLLAKYQHDGSPVMLVDSDVVFKSLDSMPVSDGTTVYGSDVSSYIDARYLDGTDPDVLGCLALVAGIDPSYVRQHAMSIGAQYLLPHLFDRGFWADIETKSNVMFNMLRGYTCKHHPVQTWTASMWAILYQLYAEEIKGNCTVKTHPSMDFAWATDHISAWTRYNILHAAGVTEDMQAKGYFYKGAYTTAAPFNADLSHVVDYNCSAVYANKIKEYAQERT